MSYQIIKQPNNKYCIFSSVVDYIIHYNMTIQEIIDLYVKKSKDKIEHEVIKIRDIIEEGGKPYHQFTMSYDEVINYIKEVHGKAEAENVINEIES